MSFGNSINYVAVRAPKKGWVALKKQNKLNIMGIYQKIFDFFVKSCIISLNLIQIIWFQNRYFKIIDLKIFLGK